MCIQRPAEMMHLEDISTLKENTVADICIIKIKEKDFIFSDKYCGKLNADRLIIPLLTLKDGKVLYRNIEF